MSLQQRHLAIAAGLVSAAAAAAAAAEDDAQWHLHSLYLLALDAAAHFESCLDWLAGAGCRHWLWISLVQAQPWTVVYLVVVCVEGTLHEQAAYQESIISSA